MDGVFKCLFPGSAAPGPDPDAQPASRRWSRGCPTPTPSSSPLLSGAPAAGCWSRGCPHPTPSSSPSLLFASPRGATGEIRQLSEGFACYASRGDAPHSEGGQATLGACNSRRSFFLRAACGARRPQTAKSEPGAVNGPSSSLVERPWPWVPVMRHPTSGNPKP